MKTLAVSLFILSFMSLSAFSTEVVLTPDFLVKAPATQYRCARQIYAYLTLSREIFGNHSLTAQWLRPDGKIQEEVNLDVHLKAGGQHQIYFWIDFKEDSPLKDLFSWDHNSEEPNDFDGSWVLKTFCDGELLTKTDFSVHCP